MNTEEMARIVVERSLKDIRLNFYEFAEAVDILKPITYDEYFKIGNAVSAKERNIVNTDGKYLIYDPEKIVNSYAFSQKDYIEERIIHVLLHGLLGHFYDSGEYVRKKLAWTVMDIQVEQLMKILSESGWRRIARFDDYPACREEPLETEGMSLYQAALRDAKLYRRTLRAGMSLRSCGDDHEFWWHRRKKRGRKGKDGYQKIQDESEWEKALCYMLGCDRDRLKSAEIMKMVRNALITNSGGNSQHGLEPGSEKKDVRAEGDRMDFCRMFSGFLSVKAVSRDKDDHFDTMLYEYGLEMYGDVPLIEPQDEIEEKRMNNLVIAIDTSGSCMGYLGIFINQILEIFDEIGGKTEFDGIYVLQCDAEVTDVKSFTSPSELKEYKSVQRVYGFGGTDFRSVFEWVEKELKSKGKITDCVLFFTDGDGEYPKHAPEYPVFMVIPKEECIFDDEFGFGIPKWVKKTELNKT